MKLCRCLWQNQIRHGVIEDGRVDFLEDSFLRTDKRSGDSAPLAAVRLLAPLMPPNIVAIGTNYLGHVQETNAPLPERPLVFLKATSAVIGPEDPIELPRMAPDAVDYEAELAIVIGKTARHISRDEALNCVLGYTCANDVSARDCQIKQDRQWARGKSFDTFCPLGPWIETDLDPADLRVRTRLDGETMQDSTTARLIFDCPLSSAT